MVLLPKRFTPNSHDYFLFSQFIGFFVNWRAGESALCILQRFVNVSYWIEVEDWRI